MFCVSRLVPQSRGLFSTFEYTRELHARIRYCISFIAGKTDRQDISYIFIIQHDLIVLVNQQLISHADFLLQMLKEIHST